MKIKRIPSLLIMFGFITFMSCEKEITDVSRLTLDQKIALNHENDKIHNLASILAKSLTSESGRAFVKKEVLKEFDGDFDILFAEAKDKSLGDNSLKNSNHTTFGNFLKDFSLSNINLKSDEDFNTFLNSLLEEYPLLQISMPELTDGSTLNWDEKKYVPLVAVLPLNFDEKTSEIITAYDMNGNIFYLDAKNPPENPVIVISQNERLIAIKKRRKLEEG